ncbi:MAG: dihydropteroate synthase [Treponemataceae bacterium]
MSVAEKKDAPQNKTILCGIVNVTPDSFSDGGKWETTELAVAHALDLIEAGAEMLDIGGESTRPSSTFVPIEQEIKRVVPVIKELKKRTSVPLSVDTWKSEVAKAALEAGADIINDITGFAGDYKMPEIIAKAKCDAVIMFNPVVYRREHESCKIFPEFNLNMSNEKFLSEAEKTSMQKMEITDAMQFYLERSIKLAQDAGIQNDKIMLDPGIGFGLTKKENLLLIKHIGKLHKMGFRIFLGVSRKRFLVNILSEANLNTDAETDEGFKNRDYASAILTAFATKENVEVVRVHSISEHKIARDVMYSVMNAETEEDKNFQAYTNKPNVNLTRR